MVSVYLCNVIQNKYGNFLNNMYYKQIESNKEEKQLHDTNQKRNAAQRLAAIAAQRKRNKLHGA